MSLPPRATPWVAAKYQGRTGSTELIGEATMANEEFKVESDEMLQRHLAAEKTVKSYSYKKPTGVDTAKGRVNLGKSDIVRGVVQIVKKNGGENNLHYHTGTASFWMVLKGRVRFYGSGDELIGEFGPHEGTMTPRYARYWFENVGDEDLEILQVGAYADEAGTSGRTDAAPQRYQVHTAQRFDAVIDKEKV
jgi:mannose-6-phosphate isomerase-like protein (cupin superfamily)